MNADERRRLQEHVYPRPPEDVIDEAILRGFCKPEDQDWLRSEGLQADQPTTFRCGFHSGLVNYGPVPVADLQGLDGKTYRVGQCDRCGRIFWGVRGERPPVRWP
jgi:hypothetical protein